MDTEQARAILRANEAKTQALRNLENAARMSTDDARAKEMLEAAGDAYANAVAALRNVDLEAAPLLMPDGTLVTHGRGEFGPVGSGEETPGDPEGPLSSPEAAAASSNG
jgi:hypothetical protein